MRTVLQPFVLALTALLPAQQEPTPAPAASDPLATSTALLRASLQKAARLTDTALTVQWGPNVDSLDPNVAQFIGGLGTTKAVGSWHPDRLHVAFDGENGDELLFAGREQLARDHATDWRMRRAHYADGNVAPFVPDPALLLGQLAVIDVRVKHRAQGKAGDTPVEIVSAVFPPEAVASLLWSGALPPATAADATALLMLTASAQRPRQPAAAPEVDIALAVWIDPVAQRVLQVHFRTRLHEPATRICMPVALPARSRRRQARPSST